MKVSVENIVFVGQPGGKGLVAVFDVLLDTGAPEAARLNGFRYFEPDNGQPYVAEPAIKTERGFVRPIRCTLDLIAVIYRRFEDAWDELAARRNLRTAGNFR